jgi:oligopeptide transport system ATP-binding protein
MSSTMLEVESLTKVFSTRSASGREDFLAVDAVSFVLERGGSLGIVGESGSGKSTTARMIVGLESPTSGSIRFDGQEVEARPSAKARRARARKIQMVFQDPFASLDPRQSLGSAIDEVLQVHFRLPSPKRRARIEQLFDQVGLDEQHLAAVPRNLSGGQRQRFAIARSLALEPEVLILDEAVSALDVSVQAQVLNLLADLRQELNISYLFVSHDLAVIRQITDTCIVMNRGRIVEQGLSSEILDRPKMDYTKKLIAAVPGPGWKPRRQDRVVA